jgi:hypothetical protein
VRATEANASNLSFSVANRGIVLISAFRASIILPSRGEPNPSPGPILRQRVGQRVGQRVRRTYIYIGGGKADAAASIVMSRKC